MMIDTAQLEKARSLCKDDASFESLKRLLASSENTTVLFDEALRLKTVLSNAPLGVWAVDKEGILSVLDGSILQKEKLDAAHFLGQSVFALLPDDLVFVDYMRRALAGEIFSIDYQYREYSLELRHQPMFDENNAIVGVIGVVLDMSERRRLEADLRHGQKMEAIGQLAGGIAHDFNNILTVILTYADALLYELPEIDPRRRDVDEIRIAASRAATLTRQLLTFSRREMTRPQAVNMNKTVDGLSKLLGRLIGADVEVKYQLDDELNDVWIDPGYIEQIVLNLVVNARDALPSGGRVEIETANVWFDAKRAAEIGLQEGHHARLSVADTGHGMDSDTLHRIYEPFFTTRESGRGTGMGLSTVFGIVKQNQGAISVESEVGKGTRFDVFLPWATETKQKELVEERPKEIKGKGEVILLVEDEAALRRLSSRVLRDYGYEVLEARDGEHALSKASRNEAPIDLLVTDLVMPRMGGREVATKLQEINSNIRVLFTSGYPDQLSELSELSGNRLAFLPKPYTRMGLLNEVQTVLNSRD
ncbi:MAG: hypothetical protein AUK47_07165 [Deltaproteobacteria bacterium CG2_30_63_29]|nr:MAG: hypothetical protein AUK47_07165 [Deltaproteobacteria bacterium CG2_30_63_29]